MLIKAKRDKFLNFFNKKYLFFVEDQEWNYPKGLEWYKKYFRHCKLNQIKGEFSPHYFNDPKAPYLIKKCFPKVKIIICLRDPVERLYSNYLHAKYRLIKKGIYLTFEDVIQKYPEFVAIGFYHQHIKNYLKYFSRENIKIIFQEKIKENNLKVIQEIYDFLEVDPNFVPDSLNKKINIIASKISPIRYNFLRFKIKLMNSHIKNKITPTLKKIKLNKLIIKTIINPLNKATFHLSKNKTTYKPMNPDTKKYLKNLYKPHNKKLEKLLSIKLNIWN